MLWWHKLTCPLVIAISHGSVTCVKGKLSAGVVSDIRQVLKDAGVKHGNIHRAGNLRIGFSANIPQTCHQPIRNLLASA